jgi:transposase-like protein
MNKEKTQLVEVRKGSKVANKDYIQTDEARIKITSSYKYLWITLQTSGTSFSLYVT